MSTIGDTRRMVCKTVLQIAQLDDDETRDASADAHGSWVAHQFADRDDRITALEAELAALRAPAEEAGYTLSEDGKCWTGKGGGRGFFQGPPIKLEDEPSMDHHLDDARQCLIEIETGCLEGDNETGAALQALAHATIAQAELLTVRNDLLRQSLAVHTETDAALVEIAAKDPPPHIRYGALVYPVDGGFAAASNNFSDEAHGPTPAAACAAFDRLWETGSAEAGEPQ